MVDCGSKGKTSWKLELFLGAEVAAAISRAKLQQDFCTTQLMICKISSAVANISMVLKSRWHVITETHA